MGLGYGGGGYGRGCGIGGGGGEGRKGDGLDGFGTEVVQAADAEEGAVGAVEVFGAVFRGVMLEEREAGAAVGQAGVADA